MGSPSSTGRAYTSSICLTSNESNESKKTATPKVNLHECVECKCNYQHVEEGQFCTVCKDAHIYHLHLPTKPDKYTKWECLVARCPDKYELKYIEKHMEKHHFYCRKCHAGFQDWETLVKHRISSELHYACNFCGTEFKSVHGIKKHIELGSLSMHPTRSHPLTLHQDHPPKQNLKCIGCSQVFDRAAFMILHLEQGHCGVIHPQVFAGHLQQKRIIGAILNDRPTIAPAFGFVDAAYDTDVGGGVSLQMDEHNVLEAEQNHIPEGSQPDVLQPEKEPASDFFSQRATTTGSSISSPSPAGGPSIAESLSTLSLSGRSGGAALNSTNGASSSAASTTGSEKPWGDKIGAAKRMFPNAKATPADPNWLEKQKQADRSSFKRDGPNLLYDRYWDPHSQHYKPDTFYHTILERYFCPFPPCLLKFKESKDLTAHILREHQVVQTRCPCCHKWFKSAAALVGHAEAGGGKCRISKTGNYPAFIHEISGGFIQTAKQAYPDLPTQRVIEFKKDEDDKKVAVGVNHVDHTVWSYESVRPSDWEEVEEQRKQEYEKRMALDPAGYNIRHYHVNTYTSFQGGRPSLQTGMQYSSTFPLRDLVGSSSQNDYQSGLRTQEDGVQEYSMLDPAKQKQQKKRDAWSKFASSIQGPEEYSSLLGSGSVKIDGFESEDEDEGEETETEGGR